MVFRFDYGVIEVLLKLITVSFHQKGGFLMKQFKKIFSLLLSFCILMMPPTTAFAATPTQNYEQTVTLDDVLKLKPYVIRNEDGTVVVDAEPARIAVVFPVTAEVAGIIAAGAAFDAGYWWLLATRIGANNNGNGAIINMTHVLVFDIAPQ